MELITYSCYGSPQGMPSLIKADSQVEPCERPHIHRLHYNIKGYNMLSEEGVILTGLAVTSVLKN
jgi:hypothetical protein